MPLRRPLLLLAAVLAVPLVPLAILGLSFEDRVQAWFEATAMPPAARFATVVGLLAIDIFLPIPSSAVSTWGGGVLGLWPATVASALGMTAGAILGFALARALGRPFAARLAGSRDLDQTAALAQRFGPLALVVTRALPILAEACVLLMGAGGLSWRRFLIPVIASNVVVAAVYSACGVWFGDRNALPVAVLASGTLPLLAALLARRWLPAKATADEGAGTGPGAAPLL